MTKPVKDEVKLLSSLKSIKQFLKQTIPGSYLSLVMLGIAMLLSLIGVIYSEVWLKTNICAIFFVFFLSLLIKYRHRWSFDWSPYQSSRVASVFAELVPPLIVVTVVCAIFRDIFKGNMPHSYDHPLQLFNGWVMSEKLLPSLRLNGWVHERGLGFPAGILYPQGSQYLTALVKFLMPKNAGWDKVYSVSFLISMLIWHLSVYGTGRLAIGRLGGMIAGLLSVIDPGAYWEGGREFAVFWGVWPSCVAAGLALFSMSLFYKSLTKPNVSGVAASALIAGYAIMTHPIALILTGMAAFLSVVHVVIQNRRPSPGAIAFKGLSIFLLSIGIASVWLLPFFAYRKFSLALISNAPSIENQLNSLLTFTFFDSMKSLVFFFAVVGVFVAWIQERPLPRFYILLSGLILAISNQTAIMEGWLTINLDDFIFRLQPRRFYLFVRLVAFVLAGYALVWLVRAISRNAGPSRQENRNTFQWRPVLGIALSCIIFGTYVVPLGKTLFADHLSNTANWRHKPDIWPHYMAVTSELREREKEKFGISRVMWDLKCQGNPHHCYESSPAFTNLPHYHPGFHSCATFTGFFSDNKGKPNFSGNLLSRRFANVKYIVTTQKKVVGANKIFSSGKLNIFEDPEVQPTKPFSVKGKAEAALNKLEDEYLSFNINNTSSTDEFILHVSYFSNWHAYLNGKEIPIDKWDGPIRHVMRVNLNANGILEFKYIHGLPERIGFWITLLSLLICILIGPLKKNTTVAIRRLRLPFFNMIS